MEYRQLGNGITVWTRDTDKPRLVKYFSEGLVVYEAGRTEYAMPTHEFLEVHKVKINPGPRRIWVHEIGRYITVAYGTVGHPVQVSLS